MDLFNINKSLFSSELKVSDFGELRFNLKDYSTGLKGTFMYEVFGQFIREGQVVSFSFVVHKDCTVGQFFESLDAYFTCNSTS